MIAAFPLPLCVEPQSLPHPIYQSRPTYQSSTSKSSRTLVIKSSVSRGSRWRMLFRIFTENSSSHNNSQLWFPAHILVFPDVVGANPRYTRMIVSRISMMSVSERGQAIFQKGRSGSQLCSWSDSRFFMTIFCFVVYRQLGSRQQ